MKKILLTISALLAAASIYAQDAAGVAMPFSVVPRNVKTLSLGGIGAADDPAMRIFGDDAFDASVSWYSWSPKGTPAKDINADVFARFGKRVGVSLQMGLDNGEKYDIYDDKGTKGGFYSPRDMMVKAGASFRIIPMLSLSASVRYLSSSLSANNSYSAVGADVLVGAELGPARVAAGVTNLGSSVKAADGTAFPIPTAATIAGDFGLTLAELHDITVRAQADYFFKGGIRAGAGLEYGFNDLAFLRLGYSYGGKTAFPSYFSIGLGGKIAGVTLNAAYLVGSEAIGGTLAIGAGYCF